MYYKETLPDSQFSHHVESYWQVSTDTLAGDQSVEMFLPTCTFNIIFTETPCYVRSNLGATWILLEPGAAFIGQTNTSLFFKSKKSIKIIGARFKPFAFANIIKGPIFQFNDSILALNKVFPISKSGQLLIDKITADSSVEVPIQYINEFVDNLLFTSSVIDERLRAQLNFIMERHGSLKISELFAEFKTSKVTLHKHFINKVGLSPKKVSQIWRMNRILQLKEEFPEMNLTSLSYAAGFYDQAHFIKDFKSIFDSTPSTFFSQKSSLIEITSLNIMRRFSNQYDPKTI